MVLFIFISPELLVYLKTSAFIKVPGLFNCDLFSCPQGSERWLSHTKPPTAQRIVRSESHLAGWREGQFWFHWGVPCSMVSFKNWDWRASPGQLLKMVRKRNTEDQPQRVSANNHSRAAGSPQSALTHPSGNTALQVGASGGQRQQEQALTVLRS